MENFSTKLINWQKQHGRHDLPWQVNDPYRIWLSEIMLQQTQVATVAEYYPRFVATFPTITDLANAPQDQILALWAGLGYYSRARNLHKAAQQIVENFGGTFPKSRQELETLCGVGRSTAAAIAAFAFEQRETILDGNVKRVLCRIFALDGDPTDKKFEQTLWALAETLLPKNSSDMPTYIQGLMDLGATVCKRTHPRCQQCPMDTSCLAKAQNRTAELPRKKAPKTIKRITLFWLMAQRQDGAIMLHKRPQNGIWAGLYCLPCFEQSQNLHDFANQLSPHIPQQYPSFNHRLTHRLLDIIPFTLRNLPLSTPACVEQMIWVMPQQLSTYGLPKPLTSWLRQDSLF